MPNVLCQIEKGVKERKHEDVEGAGRVSALATRANKKAKPEEAYRLIDEDQDQFPIYFAWKSIKSDNLLRSRKMLSSEVRIKFSILGCDGMCQAINTMFMRTLLFSLLSSHSPMMIQFLSISFFFSLIPPLPLFVSCSHFPFHLILILRFIRWITFCMHNDSVATPTKQHLHFLHRKRVRWFGCERWRMRHIPNRIIYRRRQFCWYTNC